MPTGTSIHPDPALQEGALDFIKQWLSTTRISASFTGQSMLFNAYTYFPGELSEDFNFYQRLATTGGIISGLTATVGSFGAFVFFKNNSINPSPAISPWRSFHLSNIVAGIGSVGLGASASWFVGHQDMELYKQQAMQAMLINATRLYESRKYKEARTKLDELNEQLGLGLGGWELLRAHRFLEEQVDRTHAYHNDRRIQEALKIINGPIMDLKPYHEWLRFMNQVGEHASNIAHLLCIMWECSVDAEAFSPDNFKRIEACAVILSNQLSKIQEMKQQGFLTEPLLQFMITHSSKSHYINDIYEQFRTHLAGNHSTSNKAQISRALLDSIQEFQDVEQKNRDQLSILENRNKAPSPLQTGTIFPSNVGSNDASAEDKKLLADIERASELLSREKDAYTKKFVYAEQPGWLKRQCAVLDGFANKLLKLNQQVSQRIRRFEGPREASSNSMTP